MATTRKIRRSDARYYFHVTTKRWGQKVLLKPRKPGDNSDTDYEPTTPRICVCPDVAGCLVALGCTMCHGSQYYVYRTARKVCAVKPRAEKDESVDVGIRVVSDARVTGEHWLLKPTAFVKVGTIESEYLPYVAVEGHTHYLNGEWVPVEIGVYDLNTGTSFDCDHHKQRQFRRLLKKTQATWLKAA